MALGQKPTNLVAWNKVGSGPALAHHVGCVISGMGYIHGGIRQKLGKLPERALYSVNLATLEWRELDSAGPALSHHACVVLDGRFIVLIGGWNGQSRTSDVHVYDAVGGAWSRPRVAGFAEGAGLSSHSATLLRNREILIIGREGGLRTQRRHGDMFMLTYNASLSSFQYSMHSGAVDSRSGHTAHVVHSKLVVIGGRADRLLDMHYGYHSPSADRAPSAVFHRLSDLVQGCAPMSKPPASRKNHVSASSHSYVLVHGGETFDGRSRFPVGDTYLMQATPKSAGVTWYQLGGVTPSDPASREGHVVLQTEAGLWIQGGAGERNAVTGDIYQLIV